MGKGEKMKKLLTVLAIVLMASVVSAATLKWDASTGDVDGYIVEYLAGNAFPDGVDPFTALTPAIEYNIDSLHLETGVEHIFRVRAHNSTGQSGPSNSVSYTRPAFLPIENLKPFTIVIPGLPTQVIINIEQ